MHDTQPDPIGQLTARQLDRLYNALTISIVEKFRSEFEDHLVGRCAYKNADALLGAR